MLLYYNKMKAKQKTNHLNFTHWSRMFGIIISMFEYKTDADTNIDFDYLERYMATEGVAFIGKVNDKLVAMVGTRTDELNEYGLGTKVYATTQNGDTFKGTIGVDCVAVYNNNLFLPEMELSFFADILTELDKSLELNILYTRDYPIPIPKDDREKQVITTAIKNMREGVPATIVSRNVLKDFMGDNQEVIQTLELSNPDRIHNIQYLLKAYEDIEKRFWCRYGHNISTSQKMAQVTETELNGTDSVSMVYPEIRLKCRKKACEEIKKLFGVDITVDYSEVWKREVEKYKGDDVNDKTDEETIGSPEGSI